MLYLISIVIPCLNEEGSLGPLMESINSACSSLHHEIVVVDDGSTDGTPEELRQLSSTYSQLRVVTFKRNFGQTAAMAAGVDHSKGDVIIMMDADGQNDPSDIPRLVSKIEEGYDVVSGWRKERKDSFFTRRLPSMLANALISYSTGMRLHDYGCTLKAYRRSALANIQLYGEMHRFIPAWCAWQGGKIIELPVKHRPRTRGVSKYGLFRIFKVIIDLMTLKFFSGYLFKPNYLFSGTGMVSLSLSVLSSGIAFYDKFGPDRFPQYRIPLLLLSIGLGLVAVFLILMGLLAELLVRLYFQTRNQKPYRLVNE
jgi:glycosyltransferase involved in cell wall biosynthesis